MNEKQYATWEEFETDNPDWQPSDELSANELVWIMQHPLEPMPEGWTRCGHATSTPGCSWCGE